MQINAINYRIHLNFRDVRKWKNVHLRLKWASRLTGILYSEYLPHARPCGQCFTNQEILSSLYRHGA